ncbi:MAG: hypothetical protein CR982_09755 [Candidatus Cloacimonadota bacterium]|nr:MAG: hypothetical protein CR982_09755 [Candidatus Cloacimonadota bacterium]PIE78190.1 MAG: hypothetical protein CSA15_09070 [Candidatus Delongbacteria bacterium]
MKLAVIKTNISIAIDSLKSNLLRSFLTTLGIIFGVGAVIAMTSIGEGAKEEIMSSIKQLGLENIIVENIPTPSIEDSNLNSVGLSLRDLNFLKQNFPKYMITGVINDQVNSIINRKVTNLTLKGVSPEYFNINRISLESGRFFSESDNSNSSKTVLINSKLSKQYFTGVSPLGKRIKLGKDWYTVIGVIKLKKLVKKGKVKGVEISNNENTVFIPIGTYHKRMKNYSIVNLDKIIFNSGSESYVTPFTKILNNKLDKLHNGVKDYKLIVPKKLLEQSQKTQNIFNIVMGAIASISLIVGGIGIMNIMLANGLERRKEIGLRRAIGATRSNIIHQFVIESSVISIFGGIIGIFLGFVMTFLISKYAEWETSITLSSILLAFLVSVGVGMIFGIFPARKAAQMNPIEALRYE